MQKLTIFISITSLFFLGGCTSQQITLPDANIIYDQSCNRLNDDAELVTCAYANLQKKVDLYEDIYDGLKEALGTKAAQLLPIEKEEWLERVSGYCGISNLASLESVARMSLDLPRVFCLEKFVETRISDLRVRHQSANEYAEQFTTLDYPPVNSTLGDQLIPSIQIPQNKFSAFYLRSGTPSTLVATDTVDFISINYSRDDFHDIRSEDFEAYWVGNFFFEEPTKKIIALDQSRSYTRIIIDRKLIYEGSGDEKISYEFPAGNHTIEVEYVNNWHTTGMSMTLLDNVRFIRPSELRQLLSGLAPDNTVIQQTAVYESNSLENNIDIYITENQFPTILVFSSYNAVRWRLNNTNDVDVRAIVIGSSNPGSTIQMDDTNENVPVFYLDQRLGSYRVKPQCRCIDATLSCEGTNLKSTVQTLSSILGYPVIGVSGEYSASKFTLPQIQITPEILEDVSNLMSQLSEERNQCKATGRI